MDHVCKFKERYHFPPLARGPRFQVKGKRYHSPHTPTHGFRSIDHACKFQQRYINTPPHPNPRVSCLPARRDGCLWVWYSWAFRLLMWGEERSIPTFNVGRGMKHSDF